jgi:hypothetical protein
VNGFGVGWTLGYFINELNEGGLLPDETLPRKLSAFRFAMIVTNLSLFHIGLVLFSVYFYVTKWNKESAYV